MMSHMPLRRRARRPLPVVIAALLSLMVAVVAAIGATVYLSTAKQRVSLATTPPRLPDTFRFDPKPDMTNYELALIVSMMMGGVDYLERIRPMYDAMPPEVKRHWLPPEPKK